ncbi:MAG TPA: M20/M25/M40 family metallo-hydrolase [Vicinamibacterales bacterium]
MIARLHRSRLTWLSFSVLLLSGLVVAQETRQAMPADPVSEDRLMAVMHGISSHTLLDYVKEMASPKYAGRLTGTPSYDAVAQWTADLLASWKIKPAGDKGTFYQKFPDPYTLVLPGGSLSLDIRLPGGETIKRPYVLEEEFFPGSTSGSGTITAEVVYVGFGTTAPELGYDDYAGVDVKGKLVMMEPESPVGPDRDPELFKKWRPYSFHDYKVQNAAKHGAAGLVYNYFIVNPNCAFVEGFGWAAVSRVVWDDVFTGTGKKHDDVVKGIRSTLKPASFATGKVMTMKNVTEHHPEGIGSNVVGYIEGTDPVLKQEAIVIGAHLDHLGLNPLLMPGAHDNASGVAVMLSVAQALATSGIPLKRSIVFVAFGAEEQGVKGSEFYVAHPFVPNGKTKAMLNLESVGRGESIGAGAGRNFPELWDVIDRLNKKYIHRPVTASANANLARPRQDAAHFLWANVPTISFGTGGAKPLPYASYHTSKDSVDIITPEIMEDLSRLVFLTTVELATK